MGDSELKRRNQQFASRAGFEQADRTWSTEQMVRISSVSEHVAECRIDGGNMGIAHEQESETGAALWDLFISKSREPQVTSLGHSP